MEIKDLRATKTLLSQVNTISKSYEKVAQATGENFNIFSVLGIEHYEVGTHSKFIAHLLNPKGKHGFGNRFLELFINQIEQKGHVDINTTTCIVEYPIGKKIFKDCKNIKQKGNKMASTGGRIDIYLFDNQGKSISIENKIYASDEEKQIVRYYNHNKEKNKVLYLTLDGKDASKFSKGSLISDKKCKEDETVNFYCISYKETILEWLKKCQKEAADVPILRETIKQYINLIKKITNQNTNSKMNEEIIKLITSSDDNLNSAKTISAAVEGVKSKLVVKLHEIIKKGIVIKNSHEQVSIFNHIKLVAPFNWRGYKVIRFDFFLNENESTDFICYEINTSSESLNLKSVIFGNGKHFERLNQKISKDISFLNLAEINYDDDNDNIISQIELNFIKINDFLKINHEN
ncbi:MAG: hypothetical protein ACJA2M_003082 [Polaribacter sp.]|jgi:hypothetical protein